MRTAVILGILAAMGCGDREGRVPGTQRQQPTQESLIEGNKEALRLEEKDIERYVERSGLPFKTTARGVRYVILRDEPGATASPDQWATLNYRLELLNGDTAYATDPGKPETFKVEMDDVESGLHEGVQLLSPGDSAILVIPSYRAYGLIGDQDRIPMRSSLVYRVGLVKLSRKDP